MRPVQRDKPYFPKGSQLLAPLDCSGSIQLRSERSPSASKAAAPPPLPGHGEGTLTHPDLRGQRRPVGEVIFHLFVASKFQEPIQTSKSGVLWAGVSVPSRAALGACPPVAATETWAREGHRRVRGGRSHISPALLLSQQERQPFISARVRAGEALRGAQLSQSGGSTDCKQQADLTRRLCLRSQIKAAPMTL